MELHNFLALDLGASFEAFKEALGITELSTTKERVLAAAKKCPQYRQLLELLYPEAFEDQKEFCKIGAVLTRDSYPKNLYAVVKTGSTIRLMNITNSQYWDRSRAVLLRDQYQSTITFGEFKQLIGAQSLKEWGIVTDVKSRRP